MNISAIVITRGDADLYPAMVNIPYKDLIIQEGDNEFRVYNRYLAAEKAKHPLLYFQDDDIAFTAFSELEAAYVAPITVNMDDAWVQRGDYAYTAQFGAGSLVHRDSWLRAHDIYLKNYLPDDDFYTYIDFVTGTLTPFKRVDLGYTILPAAYQPGRIANVEGARARRQMMLDRCLGLRSKYGLSES